VNSTGDPSEKTNSLFNVILNTAQNQELIDHTGFFAALSLTIPTSAASGRQPSLPGKSGLAPDRQKL
jgi:hypothetical protein